jgi:myo-inositol catabolism protein IolC
VAAVEGSLFHAKPIRCSISVVSDAHAAEAGWTFLTNHSHVLICLARDSRMRLRDIAAEVGITERSVQGIVNDLERAGCLTRHREGRRNHYEIATDRPMRHRVEHGHLVSELLAVMTPVDAPAVRPAQRAATP